MVGRDCIWVDLRNFGQTPFGWAVGQGSISTQSGKKWTPRHIRRRLSWLVKEPTVYTRGRMLPSRIVYESRQVRVALGE
jgi:hypothetical protein